ncbi:MAG: hypothetical protein ACTSU5_00775 [Promethearchaeota archaeon]
MKEINPRAVGPRTMCSLLPNTGIPEVADFLLGKPITVKTLQDFALKVCHECRAPRFGHTCDKEVSGIIHILSVIDGLEDSGSGGKLGEVASFREKLRRELEVRTSD